MLGMEIAMSGHVGDGDNNEWLCWDGDNNEWSCWGWR